MKLRPTIFLSGVSSEFASFRDAAEIEIQKKDCFPLNQPSFETDYRTIEEILRRKIGEADAVIHLVGFRFGFEPKDQPPEKPRRSYTQLEYDIARELNKPVFVFLSADASVRDANPGEQPEDAEAVQLQLAHRQALEGSNNVRYSIRDKNELCRYVAGIPLLATADFRVDISRIDKYAPAELIGREQELELLNKAWLKVRLAESKRPHILTFVALGGEGKTSLVAKWAADLAFENWPGCDSAFAWSFYSQGSREPHAASSDLFLKEALNFFGDDNDKEFAASAAGAYEKGHRLARVVGQRRALLILDGLEPLQYAPTSPTPGELKDGELAALLKGLAAYNDGLCIITTRYSLRDLKAFWQTTTPEERLLRLSHDAGVHLLRTLGVKGTKKEFEALVEDIKGHALTLNLIGTYLRDAQGGDIRRRDRVKLQEADVEEQGGHAFRVMEAYERAFKKEGDKGERALAILRLLGLFDRPVPSDQLAALLEDPAIPALTGPLIGLNEAQRSIAFTRLEDAKLLTISREGSGTLLSLDAHPLLREYFARQLRTEKPYAWREAHRRLYEYLCAKTPDKNDPTLEDLQPIYQAVAHGCQAGLDQEAFDLYYNRVRRRNEDYVSFRLGAFASELGTVACFFDLPWINASSCLTEEDKCLVLAIAAFDLRALGRLSEALQPTAAALKMSVRYEQWHAAAIDASNLSQLELTLGKVAEAVVDAEQSVIYADRTVERFQQLSKRATHGNALYQAGHRDEAERRFREAEHMQKERDPAHPLLYSLHGFLYCELLLATPERATWQRTLESNDFSLSSIRKSPKLNARSKRDKPLRKSGGKSQYLEALAIVWERATQVLKWYQLFKQVGLLDIGLIYLLLARIGLYQAVLPETSSLLKREISKLTATLSDAVNGLRRANSQEFIVSGLLTRAWLRFFLNCRTSPTSAQEDLDEAWEIAERGPMRLHMADIHLYRARLFFREEKYPWGSAGKDLEEAERLINECGYHRRDEELADAKRVILGQSV